MNRNPYAQAGTATKTNTEKGTSGNSRTVPTSAEVVQFCRQYDLEAEIVGGWVWVSFEEAPDEALRQTMKDFGFRWSPRRKKWAHNCGGPTKSARLSNPWEKYDHFPVSGAAWKASL